jgi:hypothetical protein
LARFFFIFLIDFFLNFILQYWIDWELGFMIYLDLLSMRLFMSRGLNHGFDGLTLVDSSYFLYYFLIIFFQFLLLPLGWLGIKLHNLFLFFFLLIYPNFMTRVMTRVIFLVFFNWFFFQFHFSILDLLEFELYNLF